jgi:glycosyltransferase involved in cell wall biosynthesis
MVLLANGFAEHGLSVDLVLATAEGPYLKHVSKDVQVVGLGASRVAFGLPSLAAYLRRERPQALLSALSHANIAALLARRLARVGTRLVVSEHCGPSAVAAAASSRRERALLFMMRWTYPFANRVVAVSQGVADDLVEAVDVPLNRIDVIYNPVVSGNLLRQSAEMADHEWVAPGQPPLVIGVGRLTRQKDFSTLIRAFALLRSERSARLLLLGEGEQREELCELVDRLGLTADVALPGFVDNPFPLMKHAALFVLSSQWEGFGNVLVEAMACGTQVVSTDCSSGPAEILDGGKWGRLVPTGDSSALASAMAAALDDVEQPDVAERAAVFNVENAVERYLHALEVKT